MRVPVTWLKEYVDFEATPQELSDKLTFSGMEVEEIATVGTDCPGIVVGEVLDVVPHPNADSLVLCRVSDGREELPVVCGAPNVVKGAKVALATIGTKMPDGMKIKEAKLRGETSKGMLCAEDELGLSDDHAGIMILDDDAVPGTPLSDIVGPPETVLVIEVTPNRPDCLSMVGMAREVAVLFGTELKLPAVDFDESGDPAEKLAKVEVRDPEGCPRYTARVLSGAKIGPSPQWMKMRLLHGGIRPINNLVDITNYVLLETGQPLHAFDKTLLKDNTVIVRRAEAGEEISTLDDIERELSDDMLMIADPERAVAVAGVMGGAGSEIQDNTSEILLESACFKASMIRKTSASLGLSTESSYRFERGVDMDLPEWASRRAARLYSELSGAVVAPGVIDVMADLPELHQITCRFQKVRGLMGVDISDDRIVEILEALEMGVVNRDEASCRVSIPRFRADLIIEADIIEEVARIHGLDEIPVRASRATIVPGVDDKGCRAVEMCREALVGLGLTEILNYSYLSERQLDQFDKTNADIRLILPNPVSKDYAIMRPSLLPQMFNALGHNLAHQVPEAALFETGRVYLKRKDGTLAEEDRVAIGLMGPVGRTGIEKRKAIKSEDQFLWLKGIIEALCGQLGLPGLSYVATNPAWAEPGEAAEISIGNGKKSIQLGVIGIVNRKMREKMRMASPAAMLEVSLSTIVSKVFEVPSSQPIAAFPSVSRDMAIIVDNGVKNADVMAIIQNISPAELTGVNLFDIYTDKGMGAGRKSLAYSFTYRSLTHTLTDEEANRLHDSVKLEIAEQLDAEVREN